MQDFFCLVKISLISFILPYSLGNAFGQSQEDLIRITGDFIPDDNEYTENTYNMIRFSLSYTNGSRLCPTNSCIFQFQDAWIAQGYSSNVFVFIGVLRVGTQDSQSGAHYNVYDTRMDLTITETREVPGAAIHKVVGPIYFGVNQEIEYEIYGGTLRVAPGFVQMDVSAQNPSSTDYNPFN